MAAHYYPAAERNRQPILEALQPRLPESGVLLELASGTGQHAAWFAQHLPGWTIQPSDREATTAESVATWAAEAGVADRVLPALTLDVTVLPWVVGPCDAVYCANMIHIAPWAVSEALFAGMGGLRVPLYLYGPFRFGGVIEPSNLTFEGWLKKQHPAYGVRDVEDLKRLASGVGYALVEQLALPANNHLLVWKPVE